MSFVDDIVLFVDSGSTSLKRCVVFGVIHSPLFLAPNTNPNVVGYSSKNQAYSQKNAEKRSAVLGVTPLLPFTSSLIR